MLEIKEGVHVRLVDSNTLKPSREYPEGKVIKSFPSYILVKFKNYRECFNLASIIKPQEEVLQIKMNEKWKIISYRENTFQPTSEGWRLDKEVKRKRRKIK